MCGIIAYIGHRPASPIVLKGLKHLEYRGYDSAGLAYVENKSIHIVRSAGKLSALEDKMAAQNNVLSTIGMGHTRWATHGEPVEHNAHPHSSNNHEFAIVHNGIIENFQELKNELISKSYTFYSETDTEVLVNLIEEGRKHTNSVLEAFVWALKQAHGAYAVCLMSVEEPDVIYAARMSAPLILGVGLGENFIASDIPAFLSYTPNVVFLEDGEIVRLTANSWQVLHMDTCKPIHKKIQTVQWDIQAAQKSGYKHFMLKEIFEQPQVLINCCAGRLDFKSRQILIPELELIPIPQRLHIVACGTSYHSGLWAKHLFEAWTKIPVTVEIASEFRYNTCLLDSDALVIVISQSGETADTLAALRLAKKNKAYVIGLCNVLGSSIAREANSVIYTQAGPEISVASTKAMSSQMVVLTLIALLWAQKKSTLNTQEQEYLISTLQAIPEQLEKCLPLMQEQAQILAKTYSHSKHFFFLGRGHCYPLALEGALKLKELSYIHAEGYAAGEMKHGPIALIDKEFPTFALALDDEIFAKVKSNILEIQARQGKVIALSNASLGLDVDYLWQIPHIKGMLSAFMVLPALQLFSYEMAEYLGKDVDQPRNLAKSVTVE